MSGKAMRNRYPFFAFRIAHGMTVPVLFSLLARNRFAISPVRLPHILLFCFCSFINSGFALAQTLIFGRRIARTKVGAPIFIIGHWRTGTTWLHELLALDERFIAPTTLECLAPSMCLAGGWLARIFTFLLPEKRPMDDMLVGWDHPQEDEFALLSLDLGTPYETILFPNRRPVRNAFFHLDDVSDAERERWKAGLYRFLQQVKFRACRGHPAQDQFRLVLKSPPHTARLKLLHGLFPEAQFIHIVRQPYEVFSSTVRLWQSMYETQACQQPRFEALAGGRPDIETYVLDTMELLYRGFAHDQEAIPPDQFRTIRYEDLRRAPLAEIERLYEELHLGGFDRVRPKLEAHLLSLKDYKAGTHKLSAAQKAAVTCRWRDYFEAYGYRPEDA